MNSKSPCGSSIPSSFATYVQVHTLEQSPTNDATLSEIKRHPYMPDYTGLDLSTEPIKVGRLGTS